MAASVGYADNEAKSVEPEIKLQRDYLFTALKDLDGNLINLYEQLKFVSTPQPPTGDTNPKSASPEPARSVLAHDLYCAELTVRDMSGRVHQMIENLEI